MPLGEARMGFSREAVEAVGADWDEVSRLNAALDELTARRVERVSATGTLAGSKVAWLIVVYEQAILYRAVMLGNGSSKMWNARNVLGAVLMARALIETIASVADFKNQLASLVERADVSAIHVLVTSKLFAGKSKVWLDDFRI